MKTRFIIIGFGWRADFFYRIAKMMPERFEISAGVLRTKQRAEEVAEKEGVYATENLDEALKTNPDFAVLCVPRTIVKEYLVRLMEAGLPILCETPPAQNVKELCELWEETKRLKGRVQIIEQYFLQPYYAASLEIIRGQQLLSKLPEKEEYAVTSQEGYKVMVYRSEIGYANAIALQENTYQKEMNMWRLKLLVIILVSFCVFSGSVIYLYRLICKPLNQFQEQLLQIGGGSLQMVKQEYGIKEFDDLMHEVEKMKDQIRNLIDNVVEKEKNIQRIEYEKLLFQINPHFLLNTLNSIQWMARMSHQDNITEFVQRLKKLLSYNLGKEGMQTTLRTEIDIVKEYIALQQMRYDFVIEMNVEEGSYLEQPTVRMLLQPLVENAIQYGLGKDEKITMRIFEDNRRGLAAITIADSGNGLTIEEINQINAPFDYNLQKMQNGNRGIGLRYVKAMLDSFYEGQTNLFVNCKKGHGTKITILIPVQEELRDKAKVTDTGIE